MGYQLGLDTGGTYTDAVLVDDNLKVCASGKSLTTYDDLVAGLRGAVGQVMEGISGSDINLVCLSTTLATNALVEGRGRNVALVLIGFTAAQMKRARLMDALAGDPHVFINGGHAANGQPLAELDMAACKAFVQSVDHRVDSYAISAVFAVRNPNHEIQVQQMIEAATGKPVSCGHHLSAGLDAPRRALTALLNARLIPMIDALLTATQCLLAESEIGAPLMVVKGDGSLISDEFASRHPVETILSGPAASVVGAQFLCNKQQVLVSDMGGTTTDIALIENGRPRLSKDGATVGGWRTMVKAIDVRTFGLGGDSAILYNTKSREFTVGPHRVMPLSAFIDRYPSMMQILDAQLELPLSTTHSGQFVMKHVGQATDLTAAQGELYDRILQGPIAIQTLFEDQTLDRALRRLEQRGLVLRAGFTPTDASHLLGVQSNWSNRAALVGAKLQMRYSEDNLGQTFLDVEAFAQQIMDTVALETAMALVESVGAASKINDPLSQPQLDLLSRSLTAQFDTLFTITPTVNVPILGLGAPAAAYYPASAKLLNTELVDTKYAHVANALGAVVGTICQQQEITINPAGGKRVSVLFPEGPQEFETLELGAAAAIEMSARLASLKATSAGALQPVVDTVRHDNVVGEGNQQVFFESRITSTAIGRPATG